jgi:hypothetical protein
MPNIFPFMRKKSKWVAGACVAWPLANVFRMFSVSAAHGVDDLLSKKGEYFKGVLK